MAEKLWVVNASPIITLSKAGHLDLLSKLAPKLLVPEPVVLELLAGPPQDPARQAMLDGWGERLAATSVPSSILEWGLGAGESAVLAACLGCNNAIALIDDADARKCARTLGIQVLGTLGVVIRAKLMGLVPTAAEVVRGLKTANLHLDDSMVAAALREINENWNP